MITKGDLILFSIKSKNIFINEKVVTNQNDHLSRTMISIVDLRAIKAAKNPKIMFRVNRRWFNVNFLNWVPITDYDLNELYTKLKYS